MLLLLLELLSVEDGVGLLLIHQGVVEVFHAIVLLLILLRLLQQPLPAILLRLQERELLALVVALRHAEHVFHPCGVVFGLAVVILIIYRLLLLLEPLCPLRPSPARLATPLRLINREAIGIVRRDRIVG